MLLCKRKLPYQRKPSKRVATAKAKELTDNTDQEWRKCIQARWKNKKERKSKDWKSGEMMASILKKMENIYKSQIGKKNPVKQLNSKESKSYV